MSDILQYKNYVAEIEFSGEDEVFFGRIVGTNDLISFEADSVKQLKAAFHEAVDDYLQTCKDLGKEPDKSYKGVFNVRIPSELHRKAAMAASIKKVTLNDFVKYAIDTIVSKELPLKTTTN